MQRPVIYGWLTSLMIMISACRTAKSKGPDEPVAPAPDPAPAAPTTQDECPVGQIRLGTECVVQVQTITAGTDAIDKSFHLFWVIEDKVPTLYFALKNARVSRTNGLAQIGYARTGNVSVLNVNFPLTPNSTSANFESLRNFAKDKGWPLQRAHLLDKADLVSDPQPFVSNGKSLRLTGEKTDVREVVLSLNLTPEAIAIVEDKFANFGPTPAGFLKLSADIKIGSFTRTVDIDLRIACVQVAADGSVRSSEDSVCPAYWNI